MAVTDKYSLAVLIIFINISIPTAFAAYKHGTRGWAFLGWGYLFAFCSLKIIGSGMALSDSHSVGAAIVLSVGLSPLLLALSGVLHEAIYYHAPPEKRLANRKTELFFVIKFHMLTMLGVALVAVGLSKVMSNLAEAAGSSGWTIAIVGAAVLLGCWTALVAVTLVCVLKGYLRSDGGSTQERASATLLLAVLVALPFAGVRVIATLSYLVTKDNSISGATGTVMAKVWLYLFEELVATLILVATGFLTKNIQRLPSSAHARGDGFVRQTMDVEEPYDRK